MQSRGGSGQDGLNGQIDTEGARTYPEHFGAEYNEQHH